MIFGINAIASRLRRGHGAHALLVRAGKLNARQRELVALAEASGVPVQRQDIDLEGAHQGVVLKVDPVKLLDEKALAELVEGCGNPLLLVLDGVTDPRNFGACARSAASMGADGIVVPRRNAAPLNCVAIKASSGGLDLVPVFAVANLARTMGSLKKLGVWFVGATPEADEPVTGVDMAGPLALVMGAEGSGLRRKTRENCDFLASIPLPEASLSLNVSVAAGICLFEASRQRAKAAPLSRRPP